MSKSIVWFVSVVFLITSICSCIEDNSETAEEESTQFTIINEITVFVNTNESETSNISIEYVETELSAIGFLIEIRKDETDKVQTIFYYTSNRSSDGTISLNENESYLKYSIHPAADYSSLQIQFNKVFDHINWIANISNTSVNWSISDWKVNFNDRSESVYYIGYPPVRDFSRDY